MERGRQHRLFGTQHKRGPTAVLLPSTVGTQYDKAILTGAEASKRYRDVAVLISRNCGNIDRWRESTNLGDADKVAFWISTASGLLSVPMTRNLLLAAMEANAELPPTSGRLIVLDKVTLTVSYEEDTVSVFV